MASKRGQMQIAPMLAQLQRLPGAQEKYLLPWLRHQARLLISAPGNTKGLVQGTPPFMLSAKGDDAKARVAKERGETAVMRDVHRVYGGPGALWRLIKQRDPVKAAQFWRLFIDGKLVEANDLAQRMTGHRMQVFDDGARHKARRNNRGRVQSTRRDLYVFDYRWIERYLKDRQGKVGTLASALVGPGESKLGRITAVPAWVRRHSAPWGRVTEHFDQRPVFVEIEMSPPFGGLDLQRLFNSIVIYRLRAFNAELPFKLRAAEKELGFKLR
jgi:hypothetical protein